jgi:hypothetical protein
MDGKLTTPQPLYSWFSFLSPSSYDVYLDTGCESHHKGQNSEDVDREPSQINLMGGFILGAASSIFYRT